MTRSIKLFSVVLLLAVCLSITQDGHAVKPSEDLPNLYKVNSSLYRGGQPTEAGIMALAKMGVKTIIDLRDNDGRALTEKKSAKAAGLRFINEPQSNCGRP